MARHGKKARTTPCTYCDGPATTVDHVPPKTLFAPPRPSTLLTVPACSGCNHGASADDEYFRNMLTLHRHAAHPDAVSGRLASVRSLVRVEASGLRAAFLASLEHTDVTTPAGLYLGTVPTYGADPQRLCRVARRVTLGLRFHETGRRLENGYAAVTRLPAAVTDPRVRRHLLLLTYQLRRNTLRHDLARGVLSYWWAPFAADPDASGWVLLFYDWLSFVTIVDKAL